ncbi:MAG TPA: BTAD domain-containing putative transcriptional regulator [Candidatus Cybelea sp.]|nr:BTAD domain-containing putative transcriptional regulator [Candidatus Cybelea sp.]
MTTPRLELLGGFRLSAGGRAVEISAKKNRALLGILALSPGMEATRERLTGLLWDDRGEEQARGSLRQAIAALRKDFATLDAEALLLPAERVALDPEHISIDALEFLSASAGADPAEHRAVAALYRGPFLDGLGGIGDAFDDWLREARADLAGRAMKILSALAASSSGAERVAMAERLVGLDPLREASHLALMEARVAAGDRALALKQYETCALLLKRELGVEPGVALQTLRRSLDTATRDSVAAVGVAAMDRKPTIAILPFDNMSGDPSQQYFSDGITQDIIDRLSRYRIFSVIGRQSAFAFRDQGADAQDAGAKLSADYVVTGNLRKSASRIRIAARLADAGSGVALWAEQYDRPLQDIFDLQDEVTSLIASTLASRVGLELAARVPSRARIGLSSYEHVLQGLWHFAKLTETSVAEAAMCFDRAIAANPMNAEAHRWRGACHINEWFLRFSRPDLLIALAMAAHGVELDPASARCHTGHALARLWVEGVEAARPSYEKAVALNPGDPDVLIELGLFKTYAGELDVAHRFFAESFRLNPFPPLWSPEFRAVAYFVEGRYQEAWPAFRAIPDVCAWDAMYGLACLGHLGNREEALAWRQRIEAAGWKCDLIAAVENEPYRDPEPRARLIEGLRKAMAF